MIRRSPALAALAVLCACHKVAPADAGTATPPAPLVLSKERKDLLFTFVDEQGKLRDVDSFEKVPPSRRRQVLVRDLSKNADELKADQLVYVADLTREEGGAWPYLTVSRYGVDRSIRDGDFGSAGEDEDGGQRVVLYGTSWCGACAQARAWLRGHRVPFADRDIERDQRAAGEMQRKLKQANLPFGGVPVIDVKGELMLGFDERRLASLLSGP